MHEAISTVQAPAAIGPYSQAIVAGGFVFCSGQIPLDPQTGEMVSGDVRAQTRRVLENLSALLDAAESGLGRVVKTTVFLADMEDFASMNEVYAEFFTGCPPARAAVQAAALPKGARVEIEAVALAGAPC